MSQIWTIGHSTRSAEAFGELLTTNAVEILIDVRSFPGSRKFPHFGTEQMAEWVSALGIEYRHMKDLGGRRKVKRDSLNTTWRHPSFRAYADYMETLDFREGIGRLQDVASGARVCYFCSEAVPWRCHRSMISDYLLSERWDVEHIMGVGKTQAHTYTEPASIVDGQLSYRPRCACQARFAFA